MAETAHAPRDVTSHAVPAILSREMEEEQYILRLPEPLVERMRFALSSTKRRDAAGEDKKASTFSVDFQDERNATFTVDGTAYPASLMDLPCLVETHKTADKRTFYKSGDLHQVLVVRMLDDPKPESFTLKDGLTPASKDSGKRLAPPKRLFSQAQVESVEHRVKYVIDNKVKIVAKKDRPAVPDDDEVVIEEETTEHASAVTGKSASTVDSGKPPTGRPVGLAKDSASAPTPTADTPQPMPDMQPSPAAMTPGPMTPAAMTPGPMTPSAMTPGPMTPAAMTPAPETPAPEGEDEGPGGTYYGVDDDDLDEIAGALLGDAEEDKAKKRIERATLDQKIAEQKTKITQLEEKAAKAPNPVLRQRILAKRPDLQKSLKSLQEEREALDDEDEDE